MAQRNPYEMMQNEYQEDKEFKREISGILNKFTTASEWVDLSNLLEQLKKTIKKYPDSLIPQKKELAKRLSQCLGPKFPEVHNQALDVYREVFKRQKEASIRLTESSVHQLVNSAEDNNEDNSQQQQQAAVFGEDLGLFTSNLYNFYESAGFEVKRAFLELVEDHILDFEKELMMSLGAFLLCIVPALDDNNEEMVSKVHKILCKTEEIVGTSKLFGEIWKTMLRSPRAREMAVKYLDIKIPKNIDEAVALNNEVRVERQVHKKQGVRLSRYDVVINQGKMSVVPIDYKSDKLPEWAQRELQMYERLCLASDEANYESRFRDKQLNRQDKQARDVLKQDLTDFYYPNRTNLVINALLSGLHDLEHNLVVRATFDFLSSHIPIDGDFIGDKERVRLMEGALLTLTKRDFASQKKFFAWCFDHLEDNIDSTDPAVLSCIDAYKNILKRFSNMERPDDRLDNILQQRMQQGEGESYRHFNLQHPIKILQTVFQDEDMYDIVQAILKEITHDLIKYIYTLYNDPRINESDQKSLRADVNNLFEHIDQHQSIVWTSLGSLLRDQIEQIKHGQTESEIEAIDLIICCLDKLFPQTEQQRQKRAFRHGGNMNKRSKQENRQIQNTLGEITSILLKNFQTLTNNYDQLHSAIPALKLLSMMLSSMKNDWSLQDVGNKRDQTANALEQGVSQFNDFYAQLMRSIQDRDRLRSNNPDLETLRQASEILCEIQIYANPSSFEFTPQWLILDQGRKRNWLEQVGDCALQGRNQTAQLVAVDVLIRIIKKEVGEQFGTRAKQNIKALQLLISPFEQNLSKSNNDDEMNDSNTGYNMTEFEEDYGEMLGGDSTMPPPFKKRISLSIEFGGLDLSDDDIEMRKAGVMNLQSETDLIPKVIGKVWSLLGQKGDHVQIVKLLKQFDRLKPEIFSNVIMLDLSDEDRDVKRRAVEKFATFWKIATDRKQKTQENEIKYIPFQPESERREKEDSNVFKAVVTKKRNQSDRRDYDALHKILMILEDRDPTLRLATRSWLQNSSQDFSRIIDPILKEFMCNNEMFRSFTGQLFYTKEYNAEYVKENFTKLRNIILTTQEDFVKYLCLTKYSDDIKDEFSNVIKIIEGDSPSEQQETRGRTTDLDQLYIFGIVNLTLQFIMGQFVNVLSSKQHQETEIVNASACEFMELIIRSISQYEIICTDIIHLIIGRLVQTLRVAIDSKNDAQQVILLNLLKVILFEHEKLFYSHTFHEHDQQHFQSAKNLFETSEFFSCFTDGLRSEGAFVRYHYILFAQKLLPLMHKVLETDRLVGHVNTLIDCFCNLLQIADVSAYDSNTRAGKTIILVDRHDEEDDGQPAERPAVQQRDPYQPVVEITEENEVLQLIKGFKTILNHCLGIMTAEDTEALRQQERLEQLGAGNDRHNGLLGWLIGSRPVINEDANRQLKEAVGEKAEMILSACLSCWNDLDAFRAREFFFTSLGMFGYSDDDRSTLEKRLKEGQSLAWFQDADGRLQKYLKDNSNPIQWKLINLLKPIAKQNTPKILEAFLNIWLKTMQPLRDPTVHETNVTPDSKYQVEKAQKTRQRSQECEKLLQMILSLQLPAHSVLTAVNALIVRKEWKQKRRSGVVQMNQDQREIGERESSLCQFVYAYLMHNLQFMPLKQGEGTEDFTQGKLDLYEQTTEFVQHFKWTRQPITTCWLIEILHILSNKFVAPALMYKNSLQEKLEKQLTFLLENAATIINNESKLDFNANEYCLFDLHLSPTVYEMLKRFEFIQMKNADNDDLDKISETEESQTIEQQNMIQQQLMQRFEEGTGEEDPAKASNRNYNMLFSKTQLLAYEKLPVFSKSICEELEQNWQENVNYSANKESEFAGEHAKPSLDEQIKTKFIYEYMKDIREKVHNRKPSYGLQDVFRMFTVVTLRQVLTQVTAKVHSTGQDQRQMQKRKKAESIIVNSVMNLIQTQIETGSPSRNIIDHNFDEVFFEMLTELLRSVTVSQHQVQTHYKNQIEAIFTAKGFFQMNERSLRKWQMIMQQYTTTNSDLWTDLLRNFDSQGGFFRGNDETMARQSDIFRQLSFLIFSTKKDQIGDLLDPLLKKMVDSFKASDKAESFVRSLFLLSRILMLRLSKRKLTEAMKKFWPHLQSELVLVFEDSNKIIGQNVKKEAIKVVELMSQLNIDEFQINQWMFMFDGFGIKYHENDDESAPQPEYDIANDRNQVFQPYLVQFMQRGHFDVYTSAQAENEAAENEDDFKEIVPCKANKPLFTEFGQIELEKYAIDLQRKLDEINTTSMRLDGGAADAFIEKDFHMKNAQEGY